MLLSIPRMSLTIRSILFLIVVLGVFQRARSHQAAAPGNTLRIGGGQIEVNLPDEQMKVSSEELLAWVKAAANAVSEYYGHFPVPHLTLRIRADWGSGIHHGMTYPRGGGLILI